MTTAKGFFITFEGGEGSGKTTLIQELVHVLKNRGYEVVATREPGGTRFGEHMRDWLLKHDQSIKLGSKAELLLFLSARAQHIEEVILPAIEAGKIVLCDRFNDSSVAYQGAARQLDTDYVREVCNLVCGVDPQLTLFLDVDPEVGLSRTKKLAKDQSESGQLDRIEAEKLSFHEKVREAFHDMVKKDPFRVYKIDANQSQESVLKEAIRAIDELLLLPAQQIKKS